jgi:thiosulfate reductase cytochrome b subunit
MQPIALVFSIHEGWNNEPLVRDILDMAADFVKRVAQVFVAGNEYMVWSNGFRQLIYILFMMGILPLVIMTMALGFYSEREKTEAFGLRKEFEKFGKRSRTKETSVD